MCYRNITNKHKLWEHRFPWESTLSVPGKDRTCLTLKKWRDKLCLERSQTYAICWCSYYKLVVTYQTVIAEIDQLQRHYNDGQSGLSTCFWNTHLLDHSQAYLFRYCLHGSFHAMGWVFVTQVICLVKCKILLLWPFTKERLLTVGLV